MEKNRQQINDNFSKALLLLYYIIIVSGMVYYFSSLCFHDNGISICSLLEKLYRKQKEDYKKKERT
jgi:hypothetical protein